MHSTGRQACRQACSRSAPRNASGGGRQQRAPVLRRLTRWAPRPRVPASPPPAQGLCCCAPRSSACRGEHARHGQAWGRQRGSARQAGAAAGLRARWPRRACTCTTPQRGDCHLCQATRAPHSSNPHSLGQAVRQPVLQLTAGVSQADGRPPGRGVGGRLACVQARHAHRALGRGAFAHKRGAAACGVGAGGRASQVRSRRCVRARAGAGQPRIACSNDGGGGSSCGVHAGSSTSTSRRCLRTLCHGLSSLAEAVGGDDHQLNLGQVLQGLGRQKQNIEAGCEHASCWLSAVRP